MDAAGCTVVPGFVDAHTHLVYAGDRRTSCAGGSPAPPMPSIAADGGGILQTVRATRDCSEGDWLADARGRVSTRCCDAARRPAR